MSTTRYQTRSRARHAPNDQSTPNAKAAMLPRANSESSLSTVSAPPGEATPRAPSPAYSVDTPIRLYSDVVLARIPSMPGALEATPIGAVKPTGPKPRKPALARADTVETTPVSTEVDREENRKPHPWQHFLVLLTVCQTQFSCMTQHVSETSLSLEGLPQFLKSNKCTLVGLIGGLAPIIADHGAEPPLRHRESRRVST
ncbi:hypothetical protein C8R48DRAFT_834653 [Suillus tomentosus]|nr:hypothetical protein C8R48DRAFT_834653 [Suillus tomentosus]